MPLAENLLDSRDPKTFWISFLIITQNVLDVKTPIGVMALFRHTVCAKLALAVVGQMR
jgi:hypothetical protein